MLSNCSKYFLAMTSFPQQLTTGGSRWLVREGGRSGTSKFEEITSTYCALGKSNYLRDKNLIYHSCRSCTVFDYCQPSKKIFSFFSKTFSNKPNSSLYISTFKINEHNRYFVKAFWAISLSISEQHNGSEEHNVQRPGWQCHLVYTGRENDACWSEWIQFECQSTLRFHFALSEGCLPFIFQSISLVEIACHQ